MERQSNTSKNLAGVIIGYFLIYVVWGSTYFFIGVALKDLPPFLLGALRFTAAGLILLGICYLRGEPVFKKKLIRRSAVSGIVLLFVDMAVVMLAQQYLTSSLVAIIASSTALWILLLDAPMWKTNFRNPFTIVGGVIGFGGVVMLYVEQFTLESMNPNSERGILLLIIGCVSWALGTLYAKYRSSREEKVNAFAGSAWQMLFASGMFWICTLVSGEFRSVDLGEVSVTGWLSLVYLIVFGSLLAYSAYVWLLKVRPAAEVGTHAYVNPFIAVLLGVLLGNENVTFIQMSGLLVIMIGVMLISKKCGTTPVLKQK
ncbi:EamA family transporter [uncultured Bacteroides sp.]|uniref:EamA family transporter n=1 Tax=uncultured Bacteroides sp. TaxID=162156 RepID=UPI0025EE70D1|nr:EamA family transporter [uncultured Bacteroides sp.]